MHKYDIYANFAFPGVGYVLFVVQGHYFLFVCQMFCLTNVRHNDPKINTETDVSEFLLPEVN